MAEFAPYTPVALGIPYRTDLPTGAGGDSNSENLSYYYEVRKTAFLALSD